MTGKLWGRCLVIGAAALAATPAGAAQFSIDIGEGIDATLNSTLTAGAAMRMQDRAISLIGKANLDPTHCGRIYQSCQGLFQAQNYPHYRLVSQPGALNMRSDDGNLNYDQYDLVQGVTKLTQDLTLNYGEYTFFARWLYFYDFVNNRFDETYPNLLTPENLDRTAIRNDPVSNRYFGEVWGPGEYTRVRRNDGEALRQAGTDFQLLDFNVYGEIPLGESQKISLKLGRQTVNWGESFLLAIGSINQANPANANNLFRTGFQIEEVFTPVGMLFATYDPFENASIEAFYQYEWEPIEIPTPGTFFSFADLGSNNLVDWVNLGFGANADDPEGVAHPLDNPLTLLTPTTAKISRLPDNEADDQGQFGVAFKYYSEWLNEGTQLGFYYMHYHSKLPYVSFWSTDASCARREGNDLGIDAYDFATFLQTCPNTPGAADTAAAAALVEDIARLIAVRPEVVQDIGTDPGALLEILQNNAGGGGPIDDAIPLDSGKIQFEYPEDIDLFGVSFNTTLGDYALQGELAYRPNMPLQVAVMDLAFAGAGPTLSRCHDPAIGCRGSQAGSGNVQMPDGSIGYVDGGYDSSDAIHGYNADGTPINCHTDASIPCDTINVMLGHGPGSARSFPNFIIPYRGGRIGENPPNSYIRGWEEFAVYQYNIGLLRVLGNTDNWIGADQVNMILEVGAVHVPDLPPLDVLQIEAPGQYTSASAGADGTGADRSRQACSTNPTCSLGPDGTRFNPTQADLDAYVDKFSWGWRLITQIKYESVLPGISLQPLILLHHDVHGTGPGPAENFVEGRKRADLFVETRYHDALSFTVGYTWFTGAGSHNLLRDRDNAQAFVKYLF